MGIHLDIIPLTVLRMSKISQSAMPTGIAKQELKLAQIMSLISL